MDQWARLHGPNEDRNRDGASARKRARKFGPRIHDLPRGSNSAKRVQVRSLRTHGHDHAHAGNFKAEKPGEVKMNAKVEKNSLIADYKGTCAICWDTVYPGQQVVAMKLAMTCGVVPVRNVHSVCASNFIESSEDLGQEIEEDIISRTQE